MQNRFKAKIRQWTEVKNTEPFDVVILDTKSNVMYCSPRTLSDEDAKTFNLDVNNLTESFVERMLQEWSADGSEVDFEQVEGKAL